MPFYYTIRENEAHIAKGLIALREGFEKAKIPDRTISDTLMLATWNIREFDSEKFGSRNKDAMFYIAEIISRFDLVAVAEVREDLSALNKVMSLLGSWWKFIYTDVTIGRRGNGERMAFVYDSRKIKFGGLAGEVVIPPMEVGGKTVAPGKQLARTPFIVGFQAGWFKFTICVTHILYGKGVKEDPERIEEIEALSNFLADRTRDKYAWSKNMIMLGDFNIFDPKDKTMKAVEDADFTVPEQLKKLPANALKNKHYDQIAFIAPQLKDQLELCTAGVFDFYEYVYRMEDETAYEKLMGKSYLTKTPEKRTQYYKDWRTYQMSDHLPMWIELKIDFSEEYLHAKAKNP